MEDFPPSMYFWKDMKDYTNLGVALCCLSNPWRKIRQIAQLNDEGYFSEGENIVGGEVYPVSKKKLMYHIIYFFC